VYERKRRHERARGAESEERREKSHNAKDTWRMGVERES
jgi:hypothetical protein